jgi:uncharacterized protein YcfJ
MTIQISKAFLLTLAAIALVAFGAGGMWLINKPTTPEPTTSTKVELPPAPVAPIPAPPVAVTPPVTSPAPGAATSTTTTIETTTQTTGEPVTTSKSTVLQEPVQLVRPKYILAEVIKVRPHYIKKSFPYRHCYEEPHTETVQSEPSGMGAVLGGVTGGVLGNQVGQGRGNVAATIGGVVLGAVAGHQVESGMGRSESYTTYERVCRTKYRSEAIRSGYEVTYRNNGRTHTMITKRAPEGDTIAIPTVVESDTE